MERGFGVGRGRAEDETRGSPRRRARPGAQRREIEPERRTDRDCLRALAAHRYRLHRYPVEPAAVGPRHGARGAALPIRIGDRELLRPRADTEEAPTRTVAAVPG